MTMSTMKPRVTSFAPQFLVGDLERSIAYYQKIGFTFDEPWEGFYAIGVLDGLELHLKEAPKNDADRQHRRNNDHLEAAWLGRPEVQAILPNSLTNQQYVQKLESTAGVILANESTLIANLNNGSQTRAQVLRAVAESNEVTTKFELQNFVTMQYIAHLRREPEDCHGSPEPANCGYIFHYNRFGPPGDTHQIENLITRGFIESPEYRQRFGPN